MTQHELKSIQPYFQAIESGEKTFDVRINDRGFQRGDTVVFREWHQAPTKILNSCRDCGYSGTANGHYANGSKPVYCRITYVFSGDPRFGGVETGYVVLALAPLADEEDYATP